MTKRDALLEQLLLASPKPAALARAIGGTSQFASLILSGKRWKRGVPPWQRQAVTALLEKKSDASDLPWHPPVVESQPQPQQSRRSSDRGASIARSATRFVTVAVLQEMAESATQMFELAGQLERYAAEVAAEVRRHAHGISGRLATAVSDPSPSRSPRDRTTRQKAGHPSTRKAG